MEITTLLFNILLLGFIYAVYQIVAKPLIPLLKLKLKHGDKMGLFYFPFLGIEAYNKYSEWKNRDSCAILVKYSAAHPDLICFLSNFNTTPLILWSHVDY